MHDVNKRWRPDVVVQLSMIAAALLIGLVRQPRFPPSRRAVVSFSPSSLRGTACAATGLNSRLVRKEWTNESTDPVNLRPC